MRNAWLLWMTLAVGLSACGGGKEDGGDGDADTDTDTDTDTGSGTGTESDTDTDTGTGTGTGTGTQTEELVYLYGLATDFDDPKTFYVGETVTLEDTERSATTSAAGSVSFLVTENAGYHLGIEVEGMLPQLSAALIFEENYTAWLRPVSATWRDAILSQFSTSNDDAKGHLIVYIVDLPDYTPHGGALVEYTATYDVGIASDGPSTYVEHDPAVGLSDTTEGYILFANVDPGDDGSLDVVPSPCDGHTTPRIEAGKVTIVRFECP